MMFKYIWLIFLFITVYGCVSNTNLSGKQVSGLRIGPYKDVHLPKNIEAKFLAPLDIPGMTYLGKNHKGLHEYKNEKDGSIMIINVERKSDADIGLGSGGGESGGGGNSGGGGEGGGDGDD